MKSLREHLGYLKEDEVPTNTTDGVENPDAPPLTGYQVKSFAGMPCIEVDDDTYHKCKFGKRPYSRWSGVVADEGLRQFIQKHYKKSDKLVVQNSKTGSYTYLKR